MKTVKENAHENCTMTQVNVLNLLVVIQPTVKDL